MEINESSVKGNTKTITCEYLLNNLQLIMNVITITKMKSKQNVIIQYKVFLMIYCLQIYPFVMLKILSGTTIIAKVHEKLKVRYARKNPDKVISIIKCMLHMIKSTNEEVID